MGADADPEQVEGHRGHLVALARLQLAARPWLAARMDASDLVQQVMLKAHTGRADFRGHTPGELAAWLRQILKHTLANELRAHTRGKRDVGVERELEAGLDASSGRLDAWLAADHTSPSERAERDERAAALAVAVDALPHDQREVVLMKHCQGLSLIEIGTRTRRTPAAVAGLLRRGLAGLRELLGEGDRP
ncbi:MAG TPA: sigma-70 family RNA polymerase sigma factor [Urbifossiella sp.]|jgi:RNA polymerase sigma-70 factor (ECF subfamily)|nr:sigma-70 family RNA polymerase sigma factor [Urbifossiella sp.]